MNKHEKKQVDNPRQDANYLSAITFKWLFGTFIKGNKQELKETDLYSPLDEHSSRLLGNKMSRLWKEEEERCRKRNKMLKPSLLKVLVRCFAGDILVFGIILGLFEFIVKTTQPIILANLLRYFNGSNMEKSEALYWGTGIVIGVLLECVLEHPVNQGLMHMGMKIRVACCSLIYRKALRVSKSATEEETSIGQMINLLSNDVNRLDYSVFSINYIWITPIQLTVISYLLYQEVKLAAVGGIFTLLLFIPIHGCYGKLATHLTLKLAYRTDERLRLTNEIINGVKVIKMYAWEKPFSYLINKAREKEVKVIRNNSMASEICWSFETYIPRICLFVTILTYVLLGNDIDAEKIYLITAYYNVLRLSLYRSFPMSIKEGAEALVSVRRLEKFLLYEEVKGKTVSNYSCVHNHEILGNVALSFKNVTAKWNERSNFEVLKNVTFEVEPRSLTAIIGQVGAGKTTIFHAILDELPFVQGDIRVNGKISYSSQEPWIFASSVKQNILFGRPMNKDRYEKVIDVCQLRRDFEMLPMGDNTLVGDRGMNLSGGQCARVNLARAIYHEADIYLLDDPLSAVDAHVGKAIFDNCIKNFLKENTVVLITHQFHYLKQVDRIIIVDGGTIQANGTYNDMLNLKIDLIKTMQLEEESNESSNDVRSTAKLTELPIASNSLDHDSKEEENLESRTVGNVTGHTYFQYFRTSGSYFLVFFVFLICVTCQALGAGADYFVTYWLNVEQTSSNFTVAHDDPLRGRSWYIYVYGSITILAVFVTLAEAYTFFDMCMKISRNLHALMFNSIIRTTMAFFNVNPLGRIMNRFSKDMGVIDTRVPQTIIDVMLIALSTIAVLVMVSIVNVWFLVPAVVVAFFMCLFRRFYIQPSRNIKRLEGITRSPVFNHLSASMQGLTTIRAMNAQNLLTTEFDDHQDLHSSAWFLFFSGSRAFGMYTHLLCSIFTGIVVYTLLLLDDIALAGDAGLVITQCMMLCGVLQWGVRQTTELENQMTSVERILEYSKLPEEENIVDGEVEKQLPADWPKEGQIIFKDVYLMYDRQEVFALKGLNFTVEANQMIGIVGRTGAGKSSIINALFRLADVKGEILIDDLSTRKITLQNLRSKISIIPQEPVLFAGSLRKNLDPFLEYTDHDLWQALGDVELKAHLEDNLGLEMRVMEGGTNFSVGQRQLLCLARAILRNNKILVLDEATANVDPCTDEIIQKAIRRKFDKCTVLIIAHRLNTVIDSDKILVMDAGRAREFDHPYILLQHKDGLFYNMVQQTGIAMAENLYEMAKTSYKTQHGSTNASE